MNTLFFRLILLCSAIISSTLCAEPWIDTSDIYLKANIQQLADSGFIKTPTTTYPLMWHDIINDVNNIDIDKLSPAQQNAYDYIKHQFHLAKNNQTTIKATIAAKHSRFRSFGDSIGNANNIQIQSTFISNNFAAKFSPSYNSNPLSGNSQRLDDSYIALSLGNWVVSLGRQNRWFGPTWDSSISLTNNARPMPALAITRKSAIPFTLPYTEIKIPWTVTSFMGVMNDNRVINNALLWGFRLNFKPLPNLEIGLTRLAQWGGHNRSHSFPTFWKIFIGKTNCGAAGLVCNSTHPNPANQEAGYDLRYSTHLFSIPISLYGQYFAEDGDNNKGFGFLTKPEIQLGFDAIITPFNIPTTAYMEFSDSFADCGARDHIGNCFYEHGQYQTGMRYHGRTISNLYDNDAFTFVVGTISTLNVNTHLSAKIRWLRLNQDNSDKAPNNPIIGNPLTSIAENMLMISASMQHNYQQWRFTLGSSLSRSTFRNNISPNNTLNAFFSVEYNL